jgi:hypothetical protein
MSTEVESGNNQQPAAQVQSSEKPAEAQTQEQKPAEQQSAEQKPAEQKPAEQKAVDYTDFKLPEGAKVSEAVLNEFKALAKEGNLSQEAAQKMVDKITPLLAKENTDAFHATLAEARKGWIEQTKVDKDIGGEKLTENLATANSVFEKFGTPALKELLDGSGIGDHPEMVRWAAKIGKAMGEDKVIQGRLSEGAQQDAASVLFGDSKAA